MRLRFSGRRLREARLAAGLSQAGLSNLIGCGETEISRYETRGQTPAATRLSAMAQACGVPMEDLFEPEGGNGDMGEGGPAD